ncbi:MAG: HAD family phosphatase [Peptococcaceae bacterium]|nr:HAD family phosphatase [Peptococcaceae bacterium]
MKGLIFDLDGTLLDSMPAWQEQLDLLFIRHGMTPPPDLLDRTKTLGLETATALLLEEFGIDEVPADVYQGFQAAMNEAYCNTIPLKPGVLEFLQEMSGKVPMAVATATSHQLVDQVFARHNLGQYFHSVTTVADVGVGKHEPTVFLAAAKKMGLEAKDCVVFEDSLEAVRSANRAGFFTVAIAEATNKNEQAALQAEADKYIQDFCNFTL